MLWILQLTPLCSISADELSIVEIAGGTEVERGTIEYICKDGLWIAVVADDQLHVLKNTAAKTAFLPWFELSGNYDDFLCQKTSDNEWCCAAIRSRTPLMKQSEVIAFSVDEAGTIGNISETGLSAVDATLLGIGYTPVRDKAVIISRADPNLELFDLKLRPVQKIELGLRVDDQVNLVKFGNHYLAQVFFLFGNQSVMLNLKPQATAMFPYNGLGLEYVEKSDYSSGFSVAATRRSTNKNPVNGVWLWRSTELLDIEREENTGEKCLYLGLIDEKVTAVYSDNGQCLVRQYRVDSKLGLNKIVERVIDVDARLVARTRDGLLLCKEREVYNLKEIDLSSEE